MSTISEVLRSKGGNVVTVECDSTVRDAIQTMSDANIGAVVVTRDGGAAGIFTERDYLRKIALQGRSSEATVIEDVMSSPLITVGTDEACRDAMATMTERRCRHLVVMGGDDMIGIVSLGDLVKHLLVEKEAEVEQLSGYIAGNY